MIGPLVQLLLPIGLLTVVGVWSALLVPRWAIYSRRRGGLWYLEAQFIAVFGIVVGISMYPPGGDPGIWGQMVAALNWIIVGLSLFSLGVGIRNPRNGSMPWVVIIVAFYAALMISGFFGETVGVPIQYISVPLVLLGFIVNGGYAYSWLVSAFRNLLRSIIVASLFLMIVAPDMAFNLVEARTIFGLNRLEGITPHPNTLGFVGVLGVILEISGRRRKGWMAWLALALAVTLFAQSHTAWIALAVSSLFVSGRFARIYRLSAFGVGVAILIVAIAVPAVSERLVGFLSGDDLNGRDRIWAATVEGFRQYPVFGYGPTMLDADYRAAYLGAFDAATHAHNQWVQSLGSTGIVGLATWIVLTIALLVRASQSLQVDALPMALTIAFLARAYAETPMRPTGPGFETLVIAVVLCLVMLAPRRQDPPDTHPSSAWLQSRGHEVEQRRTY